MLYLKVSATVLLFLVNLYTFDTLLSWLNEPNNLLLAFGVLGIVALSFLDVYLVDKLWRKK
jgi:hypothetical protein